MRSGCIAALLLCLASAGCERAERARCSLGQASQVVRSGAARFDAIALTSDGQRAVAAWSEGEGTFVREIDEKSAPRALGQRCAGGLSSALTERTLWLVCLTPGDAEVPGALRLWQLHPETLAPTSEARTLAAVGRNANGVALAVTKTHVHVVWSDGEVGRPRLMARELALPTGAPLGEARTLSKAEANAREPSVLVYQGQLWVAWTESDFTPGKERHRLMLQRGNAPATRLGEVLDETPQPALGQDADGPLLTFRTAKRRDARPELFVVRLEAATGRFAGPPRSIGRANGAGGPNLALCPSTRALSVPIDHAGELFIAFHPLSRALTTAEENHQYYESGRELVAAASACVGGYPLTLMAERTEPSRPRARLLATAFRCSE